MRRAAAGLLAVLAWASCARAPGSGSAASRLTPATFDQLPGWRDDHLAAALPAFRAGCTRLRDAPPDESLGGSGETARGGTPASWRRACVAARSVPDGDTAARAFFEREFEPFAIAGPDGATGLFTGYWEPEVVGARTPGPGFATPLLGRPKDLVQIDLGVFADDLKGRHVTGRVVDGRFEPYPDRAAIQAGALARQHAELLWLADPVDAFFLEIQGSGRVRLADSRPPGKIVRVTFAGQNGRPYVPIGRVLAERGAIAKDQVSMQSIRAWLTAHPAEAAGVMDRNPSYVFFRELTGVAPDEGPPGAMDVPLTPGRSMAVDRAFVPLGAPVFVATTDPLDGAPLDRLMLAQDTGGAIRGPVRGDVFWGWGGDAAERAGRMRQQGSAWILLPRAEPTA